MNSNIAAYFIYLTATVYIILWVGRMFHRKGRIFILLLLRGDHKHTDTINNILLLAYCLFNTGYALLKLRNWEDIDTTAGLIASLGHYLGVLVLILAVTHYFNMLLIYLLSRRLTDHIA